MTIGTLTREEQRSLALALDRFCVDLEARVEASAPQARDLLKIYANEARFCLGLILPSLSRQQRLLEVGAGAGILCTFLHRQGFQIIGVEPGGVGFGHMAALSAFVRTADASAGAPDLRDCSVEHLAEHNAGQFDFIFSFHVLEHVENLESMFSSLSRLLAPDGEMFHLCPNYIVPYEPHFSVPVFYAAPNVTKFLFGKKISEASELWESLNFITAFRLERLCRKNALLCSFERGVMAEYAKRATADLEFSARHKGAAGMIIRVLGSDWVLGFIERAPPRFATPMAVRVRRAAVQS